MKKSKIWADEKEKTEKKESRRRGDDEEDEEEEEEKYKFEYFYVTSVFLMAR
jgi:hypothetical protein